MIKGIRREAYDCEAYVSGRSMDEVKEAYGLSQVIKLSSNENPYAPYEKCKEAMISEISRINVYPEKNYKKLKMLLGEKFGVGKDSISLGHGAGSVLEEIAKTFLEEGDEVLVPRQSYRLYREISKIMGAKVIEISLDENFSINPADFIAAITSKTKLIWICNPNNPTGTVIQKEKFENFIESLPEHIWMVIDEAYAEFADKEELPDMISYVQNRKNVIIVRTFSKYYGLAGARLGYLIAHPEVIKMYDTVSEPFNANRIALAGAVTLIEEEYDTCRKYGELLIRDRERLNEALIKMGCTPTPSAGNFVFFRIRQDAIYQDDICQDTICQDNIRQNTIGQNTIGQDTICQDDVRQNAMEISDILMHRGVIVRPCNGWGYPQHLRVSVGTTEQNQIFLRELHAALNHQR